MAALHARSLDQDVAMAEQHLDFVSRKSLRSRHDKAILERALDRLRQLRAKAAQQ